MKKKLKILFIVITFFMIIYKKVFFDQTNNDETISHFDLRPNFQPLVNCNPFNIDHAEYKVNIDGVKYPKLTSLFYNDSINFTCLEQGSQIKKILLWNSFFGLSDYGIGLGFEEPFKKINCPFTKCELTNDKAQLYNSELVLVHMRDEISYLPKYRPKNQRWVFVLYESPQHSPKLSKFNGIFNFTSTYRIDSDFFESDDTFYWKENENFNIDFDYLKSKKHFASAIISNCEAQSKRLDYIKVLQKYISIDIYGKCGKPCPTSNSKHKDCKSIIADEYKFYFAFENSICQDYLTEKFYHILYHNIIPVVLGGADYENYVSLDNFYKLF